MDLNWLKYKTKKKIWDFLKSYFYYERVPDSPFVLNINDDCDASQKRAVICYVAYSFFNNWENLYIGRTQPFEILKIVKIISGYGYSVDVIGCNDLKALKILETRKYDLIFGFGEAFFRLTDMFPLAKSVLYMTENPPEFSYQQEKERIDYFYKRHGRRVPLRRSGKFYKMHHLEKKYCHVITMGETGLLKNYHGSVSHIFPTGLRNLNFTFKAKDHYQSRRNYLWMGSTGAIHKGLDILLDAFYRRSDIFLHICGLDKQERRMLNLRRKDNIFEYGHVNIHSDIFLDLVGKCSYIILPSCSEGFSTSITTGMLHGLIPVVIKNTGFDKAGNNAIFLEDFKLEYIENKICELSEKEPQELSELSKNVFDFARKNFTIETFEENFRTIMTGLIA